MSNYGIRHDPKVITLVILSMLFPGNVGQKLLKDSGLRVSERTLRRIKDDVKDLGVEQLIKDAHRVYLLSVIDSFVDTMKLKQNLFRILTSSTANNFEKINAAKVILEVIKQTPDLYDPALAESINAESKNEVDDKQGKENPSQGISTDGARPEEKTGNESA